MLQTSVRHSIAFSPYGLQLLIANELLIGLISLVKSKRGIAMAFSFFLFPFELQYHPAGKRSKTSEHTWS